MADDVWSVATDLARRIDCRTVFDVGAHEGTKTASFLQAFHDARVFCFEPDPEVFARLWARYAREPRVVPVNAAAGAKDGSAEFHRSAATYTSSLFPRNNSGRRYFRSDFQMVDHFPVTVRALDSFCAEQGVAHIHLLKLDTQGGTGYSERRERPPEPQRRRRASDGVLLHPALRGRAIARRDLE